MIDLCKDMKYLNKSPFLGSFRESIDDAHINIRNNLKKSVKVKSLNKVLVKSAEFPNPNIGTSQSLK